MPQQGYDTLCNWGTADANALLWVQQMTLMVKDLANCGVPIVGVILDKYGCQNADWGTPKLKIRHPGKNSFLG
jgi:hypothetical protein